jgi:hypothetical protein
VNRVTVSGAYDQLAAEGAFLTGRAFTIDDRYEPCCQA